MPFDPDLDAFIKDHIKSVWALETLILLRRDPARVWTLGELVGELRASRALVTGVIADFAKLGLVGEDDGAFRYAAAGRALDEVAARLEAAYRERPVAVINLIARPPDPLQALADAFKFRRDER